MDGELGTVVDTAVSADTGATDAGSTATETLESPQETSAPPTEAVTTEPKVGEAGGAESEGELGGEEAELSAGEGGAPNAAELKIRQQISDLKKSNPEAGKAWAKDHFENAAYKKEFGSVQDARSAKATLESLGGEDGVTKTLDELNEWRGEADQFARGDRGLLEQLHGENPEALSTAIFNGLDLLKENSGTVDGGNRFDNAILPHMMDRIDAAQVPEAFLRINNTLKGVLKFIEEGDGQQAYDLLNKVLNPNVDFSFAKMDAWFKHMANLGKQAGEKRSTASKLDPEREALDRERQEFNETKAKDNLARRTSATDKLNNSAMDKITAQVFKDLKLDNKGRNDFTDGLRRSVYALMAKDKTCLRQMENLRAKGDDNAIIQHAHAKFRELLPLAFRELRNVRYPSYKPGAPAKPAAATNGNGAAPAVTHGDAISLTQARQIGVDFSKTDTTTWIAAMQNPAIKVVLKNGKTVSIRPGA